MPQFSASSKAKLATCHPDLQRLSNEVIKHRVCTIVSGRRGELEQNNLVDEGYSQLKYPTSKHNALPSMAVDVMPYHVDTPHLRWDDTDGLNEFAGFVFGIAALLNIKINWGGHWQGFRDRPHYELKG